MPSIRLFHRKTLSGGDDLHLPCLWASWLRVVQLLGLLVPIWLHLSTQSQQRGGWYHYLLYDPTTTNSNNDKDPQLLYDYCRHSHMFPLLVVCYASASTMTAVVGLGLELRLLQVSSRGTPTEPDGRTEQVQSLLEFKLLPFAICQALVVGLGITAVVGFSSVYSKCVSDIENDMDFWQSMNDWLEDFYVQKKPTLWNLSAISWWWLALACLIGLQLLEVLVALTYVRRLFQREPVVDASVTYALQNPHHYHELVEEMWMERCSNFCQCLGMSSCFLFGGREVSLGDYGDISRALADYFETGGVLDLVPSDVAAGFLVLGRIQRKRILEARHEIVSERLLVGGASTITTRDRTASTSNSLLLPLGNALEASTATVGQSTESDVSARSREATTYVLQTEGSETFYEARQRQVLSRHKAVDLMSLHEGARFSRYALAIYTWGLYVYKHPISGAPRIVCNKRGCCFCCRTRPRRRDDEQSFLEENDGVYGDNCCQTNKSALLLHAGLDDESDLVYAHFKSSFADTPYCILLDHKWKSVVVAIRGTFSLEDCVTDVLIHPEPLDQLGQEFGFDGEAQHCHGGVLSCARIVYRDLERHGLLGKLLLGNDAKYPDYTLRIVGHSLGAATGTLLSYMLLETFPTLRCLNYSPPGCSLTWKLATECQAFCTSFVLDCELVPRLSLDTMEHLRDEVVGLIGRIKVPKVQVAHEVLRGSGLCSGRFCLDGDLENDGDSIQRCLDSVLCEPDDVPEDSDYQRQLLHFKQIQSELKQRRGQSRTIKLFPPGKLVHLIKTGEKVSCMHGIANCLTCCTTNFGSEYTPVWVNNDDFNEVVISPTMGTDHFPNRMCDELNGVAHEYGIDAGEGEDIYSQQQVRTSELERA